MNKSHADFKLAEEFKRFITDFAQHIREFKTKEIEDDYHIRFSKLTEQYYSNTRLPTIEMVAPLVRNEDILFLMLYREFYYRHVFAHNSATLTVEDMCSSYKNYIALFDSILSVPTPLELELPIRWIWHIIDEFIYQFQKFAIFRSRQKHKPEEEAVLKEQSTVWSIHSVLNILHNLVEKSRINEQLQCYAEGGSVDDVAGEFGDRLLYKMLGFFSLIGLCRVHVLLGDYSKALSVIKNIELTRLDAYHDVPTCHITTGYYVGFACMMMRQYQKAIRIFNSTLAIVARVRSSGALRNDEADYAAKQADQMAVLLGVCLTLSAAVPGGEGSGLPGMSGVGGGLDQLSSSATATAMLVVPAASGHREKFNELLIKLQKMDVNEFVSSFEFGCPKFISPEAPSFSPSDGGSMPSSFEPYRQQVELFCKEVAHQLDVPKLRSYLKLYTTLPTAKLAHFLDVKEESAHTALMCYKYKLHSQLNAAGLTEMEDETEMGTANETPQINDLDFYVDGGMVHVADTKVESRFSEFFIRQIEKLQQIDKTLDNIEKRINDPSCA